MEVLPLEVVIFLILRTVLLLDILEVLFTVPASESNSLIKVHWKAQPLNGANGSAVFKMNVSGISNPILLYTGSSQTASIGNLPAGTYSFSISPHTNVSGSYFYGLQFYAFDNCYQYVTYS